MSVQKSAGAPSRILKPLDSLMNSGLGKLLGRIGIVPRRQSGDSLLDLADALLSLRGRASGPALASAFFELYESSDRQSRRAFLERIHDKHPCDAAAIDAAVREWQDARDEAAASALHAASQTPSQKLIRMLNLAPQGTKRLLKLREDLLAIDSREPGLRAFDEELERAFTAWFNAGFLELRRIAWDTPANLLERIIQYEAVHEIDGWDDLRRRVEPVDRRCYAFFHPQMADDPLIFVEVALTNELPATIHEIIAEERQPIAPRESKCAIFYSISNCQNGLRGIPFGNYLIKRVVGLLQDELPHLKTFATLSPMPGFARWLAGEGSKSTAFLDDDELLKAAARYLTEAKHRSGLPLDPVARFHLGNGARLERINAHADLSPNGLEQAHGVMVNYVYDLSEIESNHFALNEHGTVARSKEVQALLGSDAQGRKDRNDRDELVA